MVVTPTPIDIEQARSYLEQLDLGYIVASMCAEQYPLPRWEEADAMECSRRYKNFLYLHCLHPQVPLVPTREIDEFWHNHILYTKQYAKDCAHIFGHYLHHEPASPSEDPEGLMTQYLKTKALYLAAFGTEMDLIQP